MTRTQIYVVSLILALIVFLIMKSTKGYAKSKVQVNITPEIAKALAAKLMSVKDEDIILNFPDSKLVFRVKDSPTEEKNIK